MKRPIRVLHVVESFGGGVATALAQYAAATPSIEHHLLRTERPGDFVEGGELDRFESVLDLPRNPISAGRVIRRTVKALRPGVVHAHSSIGGAFVRMSVKPSEDMAVVYTPHGYAFERKDISAPVRRAYLGIERILSRNTTAIAACSQREAELSHFKGFTGRVVFVPNVAADAALHAVPDTARGSELKVVGVGRLTPARDPLFFAEVVRTVRKMDPAVRFTWVGGGEADYIFALEELGVKVTGWLSRHEAMALVGGADAHVHTASWDGFPMVLLEANAMRIPSLVRDIEPFASVPRNIRSTLPEEMAKQVLEMRQHSDRKLALDLWDDFLSENTVEVQAQRLMSMYEPERDKE